MYNNKNNNNNFSFLHNFSESILLCATITIVLSFYEEIEMFSEYLACLAPAPWPTIPKMRSSLLLMAIPLPRLEQPGLIIHKLSTPSISICCGQILLSFSSVRRAWRSRSSLLLLPS